MIPWVYAQLFGCESFSPSSRKIVPHVNFQPLSVLAPNVEVLTVRFRPGQAAALLRSAAEDAVCAAHPELEPKPVPS